MINARKLALYIYVHKEQILGSKNIIFEAIPYYMYLLQKKHFKKYNIPLFNEDVFSLKNMISIPDIMSKKCPFRLYTDEEWFVDEANLINSNHENYRALCKVFKGKEYIFNLINENPFPFGMYEFCCLTSSKHSKLFKTDRLYQLSLKRKDRKIIFPKTVSATFKESAILNKDTGIKDMFGKNINSGDFVKYNNKSTFEGIVLYDKSIKSYSILRNKINVDMNALNENSYFEFLPINQGHSNLLKKTRVS